MSRMTRTLSLILAVLIVPPCDEGTEIGAYHLGQHPGVDLPLPVIRRRDDPELREQSTLRGIGILQEGLIRNQPTVLLDGIDHRRADIANLGWQRLGDPLPDKAHSVEWPVGCPSDLHALLHRLPRQPQANGAEPLRSVGLYSLDIQPRGIHRRLLLPPLFPVRRPRTRGPGSFRARSKCALIRRFKRSLHHPPHWSCPAPLVLRPVRRPLHRLGHARGAGRNGSGGAGSLGFAGQPRGCAYPALSPPPVPSRWRRPPPHGLREPGRATETRRPPSVCATNEGLGRLSVDPNQRHLRLLKGRT